MSLGRPGAAEAVRLQTGQQSREHKAGSLGSTLSSERCEMFAETIMQETLWSLEWGKIVP